MRFEGLLLHPIGKTGSPLEILIVSAVLAVNLGFLTAISTDVRPPISAYLNVPHAVALRSGYMALAQAPAVFALTGRNTLVQLLTGVDYQHLRFVHKTLGATWFLLALVHWLGMTLSSLSWSGTAGVAGLYSLDIVPFGILTLVGLSTSVTSSLWLVRRYAYEAFVVFHLIGALVILVGVFYHAEPLRPYTYSAIALWSTERLLRLLRFATFPSILRLQPRSPIYKGTATLVHGAIILRVPNPSPWSPTQHCYLSFPDIPALFGQNHPFSVANVPSSNGSEASTMLFVMRVRGGMTRTLAQRLEKEADQSMQLLVGVEGAYGRPTEAKLFHDILLVAGGSGITHVMSLLDDVVHKAEARQSRTARIHLIWVIQHAEQASWLVSSLLAAIKRSEQVGIALTISLYLTRGSLAPSSRSLPLGASLASSTSKDDGATAEAQTARSSLSSSELDHLMMHSAASSKVRIEMGRPVVGREVGSFVEGSSGRSLVVACGPVTLAEDVRGAVARLRTSHSVDLEVASYQA
ncbi:ferric reductase NAD binding domain-domain-containing protein [Leucosporidium creatinivorum]|uniref:Ferric reductase NAD binding domain-domain-containing protein n=1 Tax=Leucosporidium creatinivorum TaxID=106004 RepID=A0A1Y2F7C8_9BASI|nr:ferric reductase NAD binding domain-domain-containing protein [Leucosporidium creatinivorum]